MMMEPITRSLPMMGTLTVDLLWSVPGTNCTPNSAISARVFMTTGWRVSINLNQALLRGGALFGLFEQALGLVKQPRVLQRHAHRVGEGLEQAHIRVGEGVLAVNVLQADHASDHIAHDQRH